MSSHPLKLSGPEHVEAIARNALKDSYLREGMKGCLPAIHPYPVGLEPRYQPYDLKGILSKEEPIEDDAIPDCPERSPLITEQVWLSEDDEYGWETFEDMCKQLSFAREPIAFEIVGNAKRVSIQFTLSKTDGPPLLTTLHSLFPSARTKRVKATDRLEALASQDGQLLFLDYWPEPPYWRSLTVHDQFGASPLDPIISAMQSIRGETTAIYQVLFQPVSARQDWKRNIENLTDTEYKANYETGLFGHNSAYSQVPSYYLPKVNEKEEAKAHPDKPLFAAIVRIGVMGNGKTLKKHLRNLNQFILNFLYGGRPLHALSGTDYQEAKVSMKDMKAMFRKRATHRRGMILNSGELAGFCHFPSSSLISSDSAVVDGIRGLPPSSELTKDGLLIGHNVYLGEERGVHIPHDMRDRHVYTIGTTGMGKSTLINAMSIEDIAEGRGCCLIDPHGELADEILDHIPRTRIDDVILFDATDSDYIPCFNPFDIGPDDDAGKIADDFVACLAESIMTGGTGPRMIHIFRNAIYALLRTPDTAFADMSTLLSRTDEGQVLRDRVLQHIENPEAVKFWTESFPPMKESTLFPVINKLSNILLNDRIYRILAQRENRIDLRRIVDEGKILIFNISTGYLGSGNTNVLGSFILSLFHKVALSRADTHPKDRKPFYLYIDEFHRFQTDSIESMMFEARKYQLPLTLTHQSLGQLSKETQKAMGNAGTIVSFSVDSDDAGRMSREFRKEVEPKDLVGLGVGDIYARIGKDVVNIKGLPPKKKPRRSYRDEIVARSREKYCVPVSDYSKDRADPTPTKRTFETF